MEGKKYYLERGKKYFWRRSFKPFSLMWWEFTNFLTSLFRKFMQLWHDFGGRVQMQSGKFIGGVGIHCCTLKWFGGMGFKDLTVFNDALLRNQAWRLLRYSSSLLGHVLKAKYFTNSDFLESSLGYACSFSWKSIWSSKALVKEGLLWRVRNRKKKINI